MATTTLVPTTDPPITTPPFGDPRNYMWDMLDGFFSNKKLFSLVYIITVCAFYVICIMAYCLGDAVRMTLARRQRKNQREFVDDIRDQLAKDGYYLPVAIGETEKLLRRYERRHKNRERKRKMMLERGLFDPNDLLDDDDDVEKSWHDEVRKKMNADPNRESHSHPRVVNRRCVGIGDLGNTFGIYEDYKMKKSEMALLENEENGTAWDEDYGQDPLESQIDQTPYMGYRLASAKARPATKIVPAEIVKKEEDVARRVVDESMFDPKPKNPWVNKSGDAPFDPPNINADKSKPVEKVKKKKKKSADDDEDDGDSEKKKRKKKKKKTDEEPQFDDNGEEIKKKKKKKKKKKEDGDGEDESGEKKKRKKKKKSKDENGDDEAEEKKKKKKKKDKSAEDEGGDDEGKKKKKKKKDGDGEEKKKKKKKDK